MVTNFIGGGGGGGGWVIICLHTFFHASFGGGI